MLSAIMTDPFAMSYPGLLVRAAKTLQSTIGACWPRLVGTPWEDELIRILVVSWLRVEDDTSHTADAVLVKTELKRATAMFAAVSATADVDLKQKAAPLIAKEPRLDSLFAS